MKMLDDVMMVISILISIPVFLLILLISLPLSFGVLSEDVPRAA